MAAIDYGTGPNTTTGDTIPVALGKLRDRLIAAGFDPGLGDAATIAVAVRRIETALDVAEAAYVPPLPGTPTPTPTPAPVFTVQPSISPASGVAGATFTATDGSANNTTGYTRRWLLNGTSIGTGSTVVPVTAGALSLEVTATGPGGSTIATSAAVTVTSTSTPTPGPGLPKAYLMIARGQSNVVGRGTFDSSIDTNQTNIKQFCDIPSRTSTYRTIRESVFPLYHPEDRISDSNLSPVNIAAKILAGTLPSGDIVLIVPCGWGGTSLLNTASNSAPNAPQWSVGRSLHENLIAQANAAVTAATAAGYTPVVHSIIDIQGEADNTAITGTDYGNALTAAIADMRSRITGGSNARIILGGFLPEKLATLPALQEIEDARKAVAAADSNAAFVRGASGYVLNDGLVVHFNSAGIRVNGRNIGAAAAQISVAPTVTFLADVTRAEGNSGTTAFVFDGRRSTYSGAATVPVTFAAGTTSADDFAGGAFPSGLVLTFADNSDAATVTVNVNGDATTESQESFSLTLAPNSPYILGAKPTATGAINDDDTSGAGQYLDAPFDAANGTALTAYTSPSGHTFTGGMTINNGEIYTTSSGVTLWRANWSPPSKAYRTLAQFNVLSTSASQTIRWRGVDDTNFYWFGNANNSANWAAYKTVNGSVSSLGTITQPSGGMPIGSTPNIEIIHDANDLLTIKVDGFTVFGPVTEATFTAAGFVGGRQSASLSASSGLHVMSISTAAIA